MFELLIWDIIYPYILGPIVCVLPATFAKLRMPDVSWRVHYQVRLDTWIGLVDYRGTSTPWGTTGQLIVFVLSLFASIFAWWFYRKYMRTWL